jgi:hypothetical protein
VRATEERKLENFSKNEHLPWFGIKSNTKSTSTIYNENALIFLGEKSTFSLFSENSTSKINIFQRTKK